MKTALHRLIFVGLVAALVPACGKSSDGGGVSYAVSAPIGAGGGTLTATGGPISGSAINVPAGALAGATTLTVDQGSNISTPNSVLVGPAVKISPDGTAFSVNADVTVPYDAASLPTPALAANLIVYKRDDLTSAVTPIVPTSIDTVNQRLTVSVASLSTFQAGLATTPAGLSGTFNMSGKLEEVSLDSTSAGSATKRLWRGTLTFDGAGSATWSTGNEASARLQIIVGGAATYTESTGTGPGDTLAYELFANNQVRFTGGTDTHIGQLSADGNTLAGMFASSDAVLSLLARLVRAEGAAPSASEGQVNLFSLTPGTLTFDGAGTMTWAAGQTADLARLQLNTGSDLATLSGGTSATPGGGLLYAVGATGQVTFDDSGTPQYGTLSADGNVLFFGLSSTGATFSVKDFYAAVKQGSGMTDASLSGTYNVLGLGAELLSGSANNGTINLVAFHQGTVTFDGMGGMTWGAFSQERAGLSFNLVGSVSHSSSSSPIPAGDTWTYTMGATGQVAFVDSSAQAQPGGILSPDGAVLVFSFGDNVAGSKARDLYVAIKQ